MKNTLTRACIITVAVLAAIVAVGSADAPASHPADLGPATSSIGFPVPVMRIEGRPEFIEHGTLERYPGSRCYFVRALLPFSSREKRVCLTQAEVRTRCWAGWQILDGDGWTIIPVEKFLPLERTFIEVRIARDTRIWGVDEHNERLSEVVIDRVKLSLLPSIQWQP